MKNLIRICLFTMLLFVTGDLAAKYTFVNPSYLTGALGSGGRRVEVCILWQ